jgi:hypothetical protein
MSPDPPLPAPVPMRMLPEDPATEAPERMETDPLDPLAATPDAMMMPPDFIVSVPSGEVMTTAGACSCGEAGSDPSPPPQHRRVWFDRTAHTPYHPQLIDVVRPPDEASGGTFMAPRRADPQHLILPFINPHVY